VLAAYDYLSTLGGTVLGVTLGSGQHLTHGVYNTGAASTLNGTLTLDGEGDANALFIIRIGGALATGTNSNVVLTNSASLCNVYWQINGQFDLGDGSVFRGTLIASGAIHLLEGSTLLGRGLSTAGAIELHNNVVTNSCVCLVPAAAGTITGTAAVCTGQTGLIYSVPAITNATGYIWNLPAGATITAGANTNSITVGFSASATSGNITVQGSSSCGNGTVSANFAVTANPLPAAPIVGTITQPTDAVATGSVVLSGLPGGNWTINPGAIGGTGTSKTISGLASGTYTYTVTNASGCTSAASANVVINGQPVTQCVQVSIGTQPADNSMQTISGNALFTVAASGTAPFTYQWQYNNGGTWANVANGTPLGAVYSNQTTTTLGVGGITDVGSYQYRSYVTNCTGNNNATSNTATLTVTTTALPSAPTVGTITQPTCIVATGSVELNGLPAGNWTINPGSITGSTGSKIISGLAAGTYTFTVTNAAGGTSPASANVVINAQPAVPAAPTVTVIQSTCAEATGTITVTAPTGIGMTYSIDGLTYTNTTGIFTLVPAGTYTVTAKSSDGCISR
jgi:hypothetical protein